METERLCKNCTLWEESQFIDDKTGYCHSPKVYFMEFGVQNPFTKLDIMGVESDGEIENDLCFVTGPEFGCIHWIEIIDLK